MTTFNSDGCQRLWPQRRTQVFLNSIWSSELISFTVSVFKFEERKLIYISVGSKFSVWKKYARPSSSNAWNIYVFWVTILSDNHVKKGKKMFYYLLHIFSLTHMSASRTLIFVETFHLVSCLPANADRFSPVNMVNTKPKEAFYDVTTNLSRERVGTRYHNSLR